MAKPNSSAAKSSDVFISAGVIFCLIAVAFYFEASFLLDKRSGIQATEEQNSKASHENKLLSDDLADIGRAKPGINTAYTRLVDGTIRLAATGTIGQQIPSLADIPLSRNPTAVTGPAFSVPVNREPLPPQLGSLDSSGMVVVSQNPGPNDKTRVFDAVSDRLEFNRIIPLLGVLENNLPLMSVEEFRASLPQGVAPFADKATPLDLRVRLRFPIADAGKPTAKPKTQASRSSTAP